MYIHWDRKLETGQSLIDSEHRVLVFLFRKLDVAIKTDQSEATVTRIIQELTRFVEFHFVSEENLMRETGYPGLEGHHKLHGELMTELNLLIAKVVAKQEFPEDLLYFLNQWLIDHIANCDQQVAKFIASAQTRPVAEHAYAEYLLTPGESS